MLTLSKLILDNWGPIEEAVLDFGPGTNAILAPNGSGKSNTIDAVRFLLTGDLPKNMGWYLRGYGKLDGVNKGSVEGHFSLNGESVIVRRTLSLSDVGDPENGQSPKVGSRASLKHGELKLSSTNEVVEYMANLSGIRGLEMAQAVFVDQGSAGAALKMRSADQAKLFEKLGGAEVCAKARSYAVKRLSTISVVDRTEDITQYRMGVEASEAQLAELVKTIAALESKVAGVSRQELERVVHAYESAMRWQQQQATLSEDLGRLQQEILEKGSTLTAVRMDVDILRQWLSSHKEQYEQARVELANAAQADKIRKERARVEQALAALNGELGTHQPPTTPTPYDLNQAQANLLGWSGTLEESKNFLDIFDKTGSCPTCGSKPGDVEALLERHRSVVTMYSPAVAQVQQEIAAYHSAVKAYESAVATYNGWATGWQQRQASLQQTLAGLPEVGAATDLTQLQSFVKDVEDRSSTFDLRERQSKDLAAELSKLEAQILAKQASSSTTGEVPPTLDAYTLAVAAIKEFDAGSTELATARGSERAKREELERNKQVLESMLLEQTRNEANIKAKNLLEGLKTVFHHDAIPMDRVRLYMDRLNTRIATYATRLNSPFSMYIDTQGEDLRPMAQFQDRAEPVFQLSGGQFMLAAWAWHLSLYEEHAANVGFIFMDEPTLALDSANIRNVAEVVQYLNLYCSASGLQFIMVTHEDELASTFTRKVTLGQG